MAVYDLARDGSAITYLNGNIQTSSYVGPCSDRAIFEGFATSANTAFYVAQCYHDGAEGEVLVAVSSNVDGGAALGSNQVYLGSANSVGPNPHPAPSGVLAGSAFYEPNGNQIEVISAFTVDAGSGPAPSGTPFFGTPPATNVSALASSNTLLTWVGTQADAGAATTLYVCASGGTCAAPTAVTGVSATAIASLYVDSTSVYYLDTSKNLYACAITAALGGTCTPQLIVSPTPTFTVLRGDTSYVYLLIDDGAAIQRIPR